LKHAALLLLAVGAHAENLLSRNKQEVDKSAVPEAPEAKKEESAPPAEAPAKAEEKTADVVIDAKTADKPVEDVATWRKEAVETKSKIPKGSSKVGANPTDTSHDEWEAPKDGAEKPKAWASMKIPALPTEEYGSGAPMSNPDSPDNLYKEGIDAMGENHHARMEKYGIEKKEEELKTVNSANSRRVRVISDMHIGGCWAKEKEIQDHFMNLLRSMADNNSPDGGAPISHLVLLGDTWDWWLVPLSEAVPRPEKLFRATDAYGYNVPEVINLVKKIGQHTKILAVRGNHDDENNVNLNSQAFGNSVQWMEDAFEMNGVWFEHGNIIDLYSNPPTAPDGQKKKGFGYFNTRAGAEEDGWQCQHKLKRVAGGEEDRMVSFMRRTVEYLDQPMGMEKNPVSLMWSNWYLKNVMALPQNFVKTHLRWVLKQANPAFKKVDYESVPVSGFGHDQRVEFESKKADYTLGHAIADHTYDMELLANKFGSQHAMARLFASGMENHFKWYKASRNHVLIVTGHTHNPYLSRMRRDKPRHSVSHDIVYANSGAWAQDSYARDHTSYLDIVFDQLSEPVTNNALNVGEYYPSKVSLYEYPDEKARDEMAVPFPKKRPGGFDLWLHPDPHELTVGPQQDVGSFNPPKMALSKQASSTGGSEVLSTGGYETKATEGSPAKATGIFADEESPKEKKKPDTVLDMKPWLKFKEQVAPSVQKPEPSWDELKKVQPPIQKPQPSWD